MCVCVCVSPTLNHFTMRERICVCRALCVCVCVCVSRSVKLYNCVSINIRRQVHVLLGVPMYLKLCLLVYACLCVCVSYAKAVWFGINGPRSQEWRKQSLALLSQTKSGNQLATVRGLSRNFSKERELLTRPKRSAQILFFNRTPLKVLADPLHPYFAALKKY